MSNLPPISQPSYAEALPGYLLILFALSFLKYYNELAVLQTREISGLLPFSVLLLSIIVREFRCRLNRMAASRLETLS